MSIPRPRWESSQRCPTPLLMGRGLAASPITPPPLSTLRALDGKTSLTPLCSLSAARAVQMPPPVKSTEKLSIQTSECPQTGHPYGALYRVRYSSLYAQSPLLRFVANFSLFKCRHKVAQKSRTSRVMHEVLEYAAQCKHKKLFPYSLPSVGPGADPRVQAVSPQVT